MSGAFNGIGCNGPIGVADMRRAVRVGDRGGDVEGSFGHYFYVVTGPARQRRDPVIPLWITLCVVFCRASGSKTRRF
jgi:hypothetical protein